MLPLLVSSYVQSFFSTENNKDIEKIEQAQDQTILTLKKAQTLLKDYWEI